MLVKVNRKLLFYRVLLFFVPHTISSNFLKIYFIFEYKLYQNILSQYTVYYKMDGGSVEFLDRHCKGTHVVVV